MPHRIAEQLRRKFWLLPAIGLGGGVILAYLLTELDGSVTVDLGLFGFADPQSARNALSTLASATLSVAGISFSVTLVALQLASSQLSPRVLTTFREDRLTQTTLGAFLGTFAYALVTLGRLERTDALPEVSLTVAMLLALGSLGLFVAFIGRTVAGLQASNVIRRILRDGGRAISSAHPAGIGCEAPEHEDATVALRAQRSRYELRARRSGYLLHIDGEALMRAAGEHDALVVQDALLGDLLVEEQVVAHAHLAEPPEEGALEALEAAFSYGEERTMGGDVAFPVRALADVALRALSPSLNDPTTAENAMGALTDTIIAWLRRPADSPIRADDHDRPRLVARAPSLDDLVTLGFEQVRNAMGSEQTVVARRLVTWLELIAERGEAAGHSTREAKRQIAMLREA